MSWQPKYNTISEQTKDMTSRITPVEWNNIINILKRQANNNTEGILEALKQGIDKQEIIDIIEGLDIVSKSLEFYEFYFQLPKKGKPEVMYIVQFDKTIYFWSEKNQIYEMVSAGDKIIVSIEQPTNTGFSQWFKPLEDFTPTRLDLGPELEPDTSLIEQERQSRLDLQEARQEILSFDFSNELELTQEETEVIKELTPEFIED